MPPMCEVLVTIQKAANLPSRQAQASGSPAAAAEAGAGAGAGQHDAAFGPDVRWVSMPLCLRGDVKAGWPATCRRQAALLLLGLDRVLASMVLPLWPDVGGGVDMLLNLILAACHTGSICASVLKLSSAYILVPFCCSHRRWRSTQAALQWMTRLTQC